MLKIRILRHTFIMLFLVLSSNAFSRDINYNFVQGTYGTLEDLSFGVDVDADITGVSGSFSISPDFAFTVLYELTGFEENVISSTDTDITDIHLGMTAHLSLSSNMDLYSNFSIVQSKVEEMGDFFNSAASDIGSSVTVGVRNMITDRIEINIGINRVDTFNTETDITSLGARFFINNSISIGVNYKNSGNIDSALVNARFDL